MVTFKYVLQKVVVFILKCYIARNKVMQKQYRNFTSSKNVLCIVLFHVMLGLFFMLTNMWSGNHCYRYSPNIKEIKVVNHRKVRRARLYYLRDKLPRLSTFKWKPLHTCLLIFLNPDVVLYFSVNFFFPLRWIYL